MNRLAAAIFDMDGVLVDSVGHNWDAINEVLSSHGAKVEQDQIGNYLGRTLEDQMRLLNACFSLNLEYDSFSRLVSKAKAENVSSLRAKPGVLQLLGHLAENDIKLAVATSMPSVVTSQRLAAIGARQMFDCVVTADDVTNHKPASDVYLRACQLLGVDASAGIVFEDAPNGIRAAKAAGTKCIGVISPYCNEAELQEADKLVATLENITIPDLQEVLNQ